MSVADDDIALAGEYALGLLDPAEAREFEARLAAEPELRAVYRDFAEGLAELAAEAEAPPVALEARVMAAVFPAPAKRSWLPGWLLGGLAATAAAAFAVVLFLADPEDFGAPTFSAEVAGEGVVVAATWSPAEGGLLTYERTAGGPPAGRAHELWAIVGDAAPVSLGVLPDDTRTVDIPLALPEGTEVLLAVSVEQPGGSPTGAPTGDVVGVGALTPL